jgi:hypothetical protein
VKKILKITEEKEKEKSSNFDFDPYHQKERGMNSENETSREVKMTPSRKLPKRATSSMDNTSLKMDTPLMSK